MLQPANDYRLYAFEHIFDAVVTFDLSGTILNWNPAAEKLFRHKRSEIIGQLIDILDVEDDSGRNLPVILKEAKKKGKWHGQLKYYKDGHGGWLDASITPVLDDEGKRTATLWISRDISEQVLAEKRLKALEYYDQLTGIPNRFVLYDRLQQMVVQARRDETIFAVLFLCIDHFRRVNDRGGYSIGDQVLRQVAQRLQNVLRQSDTIARAGSDEFVILARDIRREEDADLVRNNVTAIFKGAFIVEKYTFQLTASIGVVLYPRHGRTADDLLINADKAMEVEKHARHQDL
jgi:diguanylate cyclase (GGDEF)-like protein/PAS domain S-box-containing protein